LELNVGFGPGQQPAVVSESVVHAAWRDFGDPRSIVSVHEVSAMVSTNRVYRLTLDDDGRIIAKVSSYGSYFLFAEDHDRIHRCSALLAGGDYEHLLAESLTQDGERPYIWYDGEVWAIFYVEVEVRDRLPRILTDAQIANLAEEMARFHKACASIAPLVPLTSKSIKSDAIHLLDLVSDRSATDRFALDREQLATVRRHTHEFLLRLEEIRYDYWGKMPVLIDWNLGNFSVERCPAEAGEGRFRLFSRWDYDWFRIEPRFLDFYFLSRVSSRTGDRTRFTYSARTLLEPRFRHFLGVYHRIFPLGVEEVLFLKDAYRFFLLNYVVREGQHFFRHDYWLQLQREVVDVHLPDVESLDLRPLVDELGMGTSHP
jgi:hypothetical protein